MGAGFGARGAWPGATGRPRTTQVQVIPAPVGGINAVSPLVATEPGYCLSATNLIAAGQGMKVRPGYAPYTTAACAGGGIRTLMPFEGSTQERLWAVTPTGIFNVTAGGAGPFAASIAFPSAAEPSGWGTWTNFTADAGNHYLFYADEENGLYRYVEAGAWGAVTDITGVNELNLVFVTQHQKRVWFVEDGTATAWYLAAGSISGAATAFYFGNKFIHGGTLVGLWSWTVDGGEGLDDKFVAIGSGGDVIIYEGTDPDSPSTWQMIGQYYVGQLPAGRRVAHTEGGDLYILSQYGVIPLTRLMQGQVVQEAASLLSKNISPLVSDAMSLAINTRGWEMRNIPSSSVFIVARAPLTGFANLAFCLSTHTQGWTTWESLPYQTGEVWNGMFFFADSSGFVYTLSGNTDNGNAIAFSLLSSYQEYGEIGLFHRIQFMRPVFTSAGVPGFSCEARYDYSTDPPSTLGISPGVVGALWDTARWDADYWISSGVTVQSVIGGAGIGRAMAVALAGTADSATTLIRIDLLFDTAGPL